MVIIRGFLKKIPSPPLGKLRVTAVSGAFDELALETILSVQLPNNPKEKEHFKKELERLREEFDKISRLSEE